jgi:RNA polymerase sigma factor (sigma-70 family)
MEIEPNEDREGAELLALWRRCAEESRERDWELLVARVDARLRRLVRGHLWRQGDVLPSREDVEELTQEIYCRLLHNGRRALRGCRARTPGELWCYLDRVCSSVVVDRHRRRSARKRRDEHVSLDAHDRRGEAAVTSGDPKWCPEQRLWRALARERLLEACRFLAPSPSLASRNLFIVESVVYEGRSLGEVARSVGLRKSGVSSVLARLRRHVEAASRPRVRPAWPGRRLVAAGRSADGGGRSL